MEKQNAIGADRKGMVLLPAMFVTGEVYHTKARRQLVHTYQIDMASQLVRFRSDT